MARVGVIASDLNQKGDDPQNQTKSHEPAFVLFRVVSWIGRFSGVSRLVSGSVTSNKIALEVGHHLLDKLKYLILESRFESHVL